MDDMTKVFSDLDLAYYFNSLCAIANADDLLADEEKQYILDQAKMLNFETEKIDFLKTQLDYEGLKGCSDITKKMILRDMIQLSLIDDNFSSSEKELIELYCDEVSISKDNIVKIKDWLTRYNDLMYEAMELFA